MKKLVAIALIIVLLPFDLPAPEPPPPPQEWVLAACMVAFAGAAAAGVYIVAQKCKPKYYWMTDDEQPPKFWVGTATKKQCEVEGWRRIGGPYDRPEDAPQQHPNPTNVVNLTANAPTIIKVHASTNGTDWNVVHEFSGDMEDFGYFPTNAVGGMFKLSQ